MKKEVQLNTSKQAVHIMVVLASLVIVVTGLKLGSSFFTPILFAFFVATVSFPITKWLREKGLPSLISVLVTVLVDFVLIGGVIVFLIATAGQLRSKLNTEYLPQFSTRLAEIRLKLIEFTGKFTNEPEEARAYVDFVFSEENIRGGLQGVEVQSWWNVSKSVFDFLLSVFGATFIVVLLTIFMLNEARIFSQKIEVIKDKNGPDFKRLKSAFVDIQKYLGIKTIVSAVTGLLAYLLCYIIGLDFPEFWGMLAFALNYVPAIGSVIAGIPPILLALLMKDAQSSIIVALGYVFINGFLGNFIEPMLLGKRFGLSTVVVIFSVLFWGWVWGPIGMLLGVPLTMLVKVALDNSDYFQWLSIAIGKEGAKVPIENTEK